MTVENAARARHMIRAGSEKVRSKTWQVARAAYLEVTEGMPPDYDRDWLTILFDCPPGDPRRSTVRAAEAVAVVQANYETMREACLTAKAAGMLPAWRGNRRMPDALVRVYVAVKQERRLGREANLALILTPPPVDAGAALATVY